MTQDSVSKELLWEAWATLKRHANVNLPIGITALEATLTAIAPMIAAQTMREDVMELMNRAEGDIDLAEFLIKARAQELDPQ